MFIDSSTEEFMKDVIILSFQPASPGMYQMWQENNTSEICYYLVVLWVLYEDTDGIRKTIGVTVDDLSRGDVTYKDPCHQGYTSQVPKDAKVYR